MRCRLLCAEHRTRRSAFEARCCPRRCLTTGGGGCPMRKAAPLGTGEAYPAGTKFQAPLEAAMVNGIAIRVLFALVATLGELQRRSRSRIAHLERTRVLEPRTLLGTPYALELEFTQFGERATGQPDHRNSQPASWSVGDPSCPACLAQSKSRRSPVPKPDSAVKVTCNLPL